MKQTRATIVAAVILVAFLMLTAAGIAGAQQPTPTPPYKPTLTPTPTETIVITLVPAGGPTPLPTIAFGPIGGSAPQPTATPSATATPQAAELPTEEAPAAAENINPLTGLPVSDPATIERRPLLVKISNYPHLVRPQHGVGWADHVWEYSMEGGVTRLTAVFLTHDLAQIGSVRSARPIDTYLVPMYGGFLAYSGASTGTNEMLRAQPWFQERAFSPEKGDYCPIFCRYEREGVDFWHTMFVSAVAIRQAAEEREVDAAVDLTGLTFSEEPPAGGTPARTINILYKATNMYWLYSPTADQYYRWQEGEAHLDAVSGLQVIFQNVVMIYADHVETDIVEDEIGAGNYAWDIQLEGEGPAILFRSGQRYDVRWVRPDNGGMIHLVDEAGNDVPLEPGQTWFQVVPLDHTALEVGQ
jgi:hypothetical protein